MMARTGHLPGAKLRSRGPSRNLAAHDAEANRGPRLWGAIGSQESLIC